MNLDEKYWHNSYQLMEICKYCNSKDVTVDKTYPYHNVTRCLTCKKAYSTVIETCCRDPYEIVTVENNGISNPRLYHQCINCGGAKKTKPLKVKLYQDQIRDAFNEEKYLNRISVKQNHSHTLFNATRSENYFNSKPYLYSQYLLSDNWKELRNKILKRDNFICQECNVNKAEDVHHLTYDRIYKELLIDLISVCRSCHEMLHGKGTKVTF